MVVGDHDSMDGTPSHVRRYLTTLTLASPSGSPRLRAARGVAAVSKLSLDESPSVDALFAQIAALLADKAIEPEELPDLLKDKLLALWALNHPSAAPVHADIDHQVLAVLHKHNHDLNPSLSTPLSRSSSFKAAQFRAKSPLLRSSPDKPPALKFNPTAHEFKPAVSTPLLDQTWSYPNSPLGTPKFGPSNTASSHTLSTEYFSLLPNTNIVPSPRISPANTPVSNTKSLNNDPWSDTQTASASSSSARSQSQSSNSSPASASPGPVRAQDYITSPPPLPTSLFESVDLLYQHEDNTSPAIEPFDPFFDNEPPLSSTTNGSNSQPPSATTPGPGGLSGSGMYTLTPFDILLQIFPSADVHPDVLEQALGMNGWDVERTVAFIMDQLNQGANLGGTAYNGDKPLAILSDMPEPAPRPHLPQSSGSRPNIISRDSFTRAQSHNLAAQLHNRVVSSPLMSGYRSGPTTPSGLASNASSYFPSMDGNRSPSLFGSPDVGGRGSQPTTPSASPYMAGSMGNGSTSVTGTSTRLCKYYLQGNCLRSDCRFSHDIGKAVCRFWLRGHCLKGEGRCEFMHNIPPHLAADVMALRVTQQAAYAASRSQSPSRYAMHSAHQETHDEDFPTLGAALAAGHIKKPLDPAQTRWAGAVKSGRPIPLNGSGSPPSQATQQTGIRSLPYSQPRPSPRISLRPPSLLPTLSTGAALSALYTAYRSTFLSLGNTRNALLVQASNAFRAGEGALARDLSKQAADVNRNVANEGRIAAGRILDERRRLLREAVMGERPSRADENGERGLRGKVCGNGLGVCLGVSTPDNSGPEGSKMSAEERTEVALDLHGLHADEGVEFLDRFLRGMSSESAIQGLCYVITGRATHTGQSNAQGARKLRLSEAVGEYLDDRKYSFWSTSGIFVIDPLHHG